MHREMYLQRNLFQGEIVKFLNSDFSIGEISSKLPNSTRRRFPFYLLLTLLLCILFIFYLPRCTLPDFPSGSSLSSLSFLSCCHGTTTTDCRHLQFVDWFGTERISVWFQAESLFICVQYLLELTERF